MRIKAIFFDLDDTLHDHLKPFHDTFKEIFPEYYKTISIETLYLKFRDASDFLWEIYNRNEIELVELRIQRIIHAFKDFDIPISNENAQQFQKRYEIQLNHIELFLGVPELLTLLRNQGYLLGIITNGPTEHQLKKIELLGLSKYISRDLIFISDEVGVAKPNPAIFNEAGKKTIYAPKELLYVGDSWTNDVIGPSGAGWKSIWYNHRKRKPISEYKPLGEVKILSDILRFLY
ncbi:MAG: HAD family hydrolase [Bacillus sp. (in: Bacteria)]|nr:HAD family hydrolase [Bacillus sp. (in: firmicutes)]